MAHDIKLGEVITDDKQQRDAIHVAVAPVVAAETLYPAQRIGFVGNDTTRVSTKAEPFVGIVDPFLAGPVYPEQRCFMFLFPNTVTGMRHHWRHPAFDESASPALSAKEESQQWMEAFAGEAGLSVGDVIEDASDFILSGDQKREYNSERWRNTYCSRTDGEFWKHYEVLTGNTVNEEDRGNPWTCSC